MGGIVNRDHGRPLLTGVAAFYGYVTVLWESAPPLLALNHLKLQGDLANHHVISVTGLPRLFVRPQLDGMALLLGTSLNAAGRRRVRPDKVNQGGNKTSLVFAFPATDAKLHREDKAIAFEMSFKWVGTESEVRS